MAVRILEFKQFIPINLDQSWDFFSNPRNLELLTPSWLNMKIIDTKSLPEEIYEGLIIRYQIHPLPFIKNEWLTEITHLKRKSYFVDEQRTGPYALWHHQHHFQETNAGVIMHDIVHYKLPGLFIGDLIGSRYVSKQLNKIFTYRSQKLLELFPGSTLISFHH